MDNDHPDIRTEEGHREILFACASRFDGYLYAHERNFDHREAVRKYLETKFWGLSELEAMAVFALLRRRIHVGDLQREPFDGPHWRAFRSLFLAVVMEEVPEEYQYPPACQIWKKRHLIHAPQYLRYIRYFLDTQ